jgi:hypothetical protein
MIFRAIGLTFLIMGLFFFSLVCLPFVFFWPFGHLGTGWLLLLLAAGFGFYLLAQNRRVAQLAFGILLLFAGAVFLSYNLWEFDLLRFWPLLLIFWGVILLLERLKTGKPEGAPQ